MLDSRFRLPYGSGQSEIPTRAVPFARPDYRKGANHRYRLTHALYLIYILAGPYALFGFRNTSEQLARRGRDIHFAHYHVEDKEERTAFVAALKFLLERIPLDVDLNALLLRWRWFAEGCVGCIGILKDWLVDAVTATLV